MTRKGGALVRAMGGAEGTYLGFRVGDVTYAIDILRVREIIRPLPTLRLPHVPPSIVGVVDHRRDVVPIVDLRLRFGVSTEGADTRDLRWIIALRGQQLIGLVVDRVTEVFAADPDGRREVPHIAEGREERGIVGACSHRGELVFIVDADRLTAAADEIDEAEAARALRVGDES